jgi:hypothetical protein
MGSPKRHGMRLAQIEVEDHPQPQRDSDWRTWRETQTAEFERWVQISASLTVDTSKFAA